MKSAIISFIKKGFNPLFNEVMSEAINMNYDGFRIEGYDGNINEKTIDVGGDSLKITEITSNTILFDPDNVCVLIFDFIPMTENLVIDDIVIGLYDNVDELISYINENESMIGKYKAFNIGDKVAVIKFNLINSNEELVSMYVEENLELGIEKGFYDPISADFIINGIKYTIRSNTVKPCYMGEYLKFQLINSR